MAINWQEVITTVGAAVGGSSALMLAAAWLIRTVISDQLARDTEAFKIQVKASADTEIEKVKAALNRTSRVHERQLDILTTLHRHLLEAQGCFQGMTSGARIAGEPSREEYERLLVKAMEAAQKELLQSRLLIPKALAQQCDNVFGIIFGGRLDFSMANDPMMQGSPQRVEFRQAAADAAFQKLPKLLQEIEDAARSVMHQ